MIYTDDEIRSSWRKAADKADQVQVLADLNSVSVEEMSAKLVELGLLKAPVARRVSFDEARALQPHAEGFCDFDIAEMLGVREQAFANWRRKQGLNPNRKPGSGTAPGSRRKGKSQSIEELKANPPAPLEQPMTVRELIRLLQVLESGYPEAVVWIGPRLLQGVAFHAQLDWDGKPAYTAVELVDGGGLRAE